MTDERPFRRPRADDRFRGAFSVPDGESSDDSPTEVIPRIPPGSDAPTDVIPRIVDEPEPSPNEALTEVIPRIVDAPRHESQGVTNGTRAAQLATARTNTIGQRLYESEGYRRDDAFLRYELGLRP